MSRCATAKPSAQEAHAALAAVLAPLFEPIIEAAVARALGAVRSDADGLITATKAARLVHRRTGDVLAALDAGELKGRRRGRRWLVAPAAAKAWAAKVKG